MKYLLKSILLSIFLVIRLGSSFAQLPPEQTRLSIDQLINETENLLHPNNSRKQIKEAELIAQKAAKLSEANNYLSGKAKAYALLMEIYWSLDYQPKYLKYKLKLSNINSIDLLNEKEALSNIQKAESEKLLQELSNLKTSNTASKELIKKKEEEMLIKQKAFDETNYKLDLVTSKVEELASKNKLLLQDKKIRALEINRQRLQKYLFLVLLAFSIIIGWILFKQFKRKKLNAIELEHKNKIITEEKKRSDDLLLNILPKQTANELKTFGKAIARDYKMVSVLFTDFKDFTVVSEKLSPIELVSEIDFCYCAFDDIIEKYGIEKIKTIGDAYLCVDGITNVGETNVHSPKSLINAAIEIVEFMETTYKKRKEEGRSFFKIRAGIHSGPIVAGVVGRKKFAFDIWGDTVNTAARLEQNSEPGKINVSSLTYELVKDDFKFEYRGEIAAKNKGNMEMYFVTK